MEGSAPLIPSLMEALMMLRKMENLSLERRKVLRFAGNMKRGGGRIGGIVIGRFVEIYV